MVASLPAKTSSKTKRTRNGMIPFVALNNTMHTRAPAKRAVTPKANGRFSFESVGDTWPCEA